MNWISVKDRLPELNTDCLIYLSRATVYIQMVKFEDYHKDLGIGWYSEEYGFWKFDYPSITHWMPLPERPKE